MGLFDDLGQALKKVEDEVRKSDLDRHLKGVEEGLNRAGREIDAEIIKAGAPAQTGSPPSPAAGRAAPRSPHPGYAKIALWVKRKYKGRITASGDSLQKNLELEQLTAEACSGLSAKTKKGFLDYLRAQNYEQLLR